MACKVWQSQDTVVCQEQLSHNLNVHLLKTHLFSLFQRLEGPLAPFAPLHDTVMMRAAILMQEKASERNFVYWADLGGSSAHFYCLFVFHVWWDALEQGPRQTCV